jgi:hypothetical protein
VSTTVAPDALLRRAREYPYATPPHSYLYDATSASRWRPLPPDPALFAARTPVLAAGSNRAPERLAQKFEALLPGARIPVTHAHLTGFDSVYCAHVTSYGSIPATLHPSPGTTVALHVTWLDDEELLCMHETEQPGVNYRFARLTGLDLMLENGTRIETAYAYLSVHGALLDHGKPVALKAIAAHARRFASRDQEAMLAALHKVSRYDGALDDFLLAMIGGNDACRRLREERERVLRGAVEHFPFETVEVLL